MTFVKESDVSIGLAEGGAYVGMSRGKLDNVSGCAWSANPCVRIKAVAAVGLNVRGSHSSDFGFGFDMVKNDGDRNVKLLFNQGSITNVVERYRRMNPLLSSDVYVTLLFTLVAELVIFVLVCSSLDDFDDVLEDLEYAVNVQR